MDYVVDTRGLVNAVVKSVIDGSKIYIDQGCVIGRVKFLFS